MNNLVQKWIIWNSNKQQFITSGPFHYIPSPDLARIYQNYSDAIMACNHYNKEFGPGHHPVELRMHFNIKTLENYNYNAH